jgi:hypothetical protein
MIKQQLKDATDCVGNECVKLILFQGGTSKQTQAGRLIIRFQNSQALVVIWRDKV